MRKLLTVAPSALASVFAVMTMLTAMPDPSRPSQAEAGRHG